MRRFLFLLDIVLCIIFTFFFLINTIMYWYDDDAAAVFVAHDRFISNCISLFRGTYEQCSNKTFQPEGS